MSVQVAGRSSLQLEHGHGVDAFQISSHGTAYSLNGSESERLTWHHESLRLCLGGLYPCPDLVRSVLSSKDGTKKRILDLGCGSRIWCREMATEFPEAEIWGVDRPYVQKLWTDPVPINCHFETHSTYDFLSEHEGQFDLIHMRFVAGGCNQFIKTLDDIQACLKPGGLFILIDSTGDLIAEDGLGVLRMKSKRHQEGSRLRRMFFEVHHANCYLGFDENMMFATLEDGFWESTELEDCKAAELLIPIGSWDRSEDVEGDRVLLDAGRLMQQSLRTVQPGHESVLRALKFDESVMRRWRREIESELSQSTKISLDVRVLWGRRPLDAADNIPSLLNPATIPNSEDEITPTATPSSERPSHPYWHVYDSAEKWKDMLERREVVGGGNVENVVPFVEKRKKRVMRRGYS